MKKITQMARLRFDEVDYDLYEAQKVEVNKRISKMRTTARNNAKRTTCYLCKKDCTSFCQSHSVPQFCLKRIAVDGKILTSGLQEEFPILGEDVGVKKAGTFFIICQECDNTRFQMYENPEAYDSVPSAKILAQIAMKNTLHSISDKREELALYRLQMDAKNPLMVSLAEQQVKLIPLDLNQHNEAFRYAKVADDKNKDDRFNLFFYKKLNYTVPIAFQASLTLICDFEGNVINNVYNTTAGYKLQTIELAVFPLENTSVIIGFTDCRNKRYDGFIQQLQALPMDEQLSALNYIIFCYSENVFVSKTLKNTVLKNRKFLNTCQKSSIAVSLDANCDPLATAVEEFDLSKRNEIPNLLSKQYAL